MTDGGVPWAVSQLGARHAWVDGRPLIGALALWAAMRFAAVPWEERVLEERFGESYRAYTRSVPRWLGRARR